MPYNNSFKPNLLRYTNNMAGKACHVVGSATQVGLTQALGLMSKLLRTLLVATIAVALPACATNRVSPMDAILLTQSSESFVGQSISIRGCLTKHQHGLFVEPCGNEDWRNLTIAQDPNNAVLAALPALRMKFFYQVEGVFHGVLEPQEREPATSRGMVFRLDSVGNIAEHEP